MKRFQLLVLLMLLVSAWVGAQQSQAPAQKPVAEEEALAQETALRTDAESGNPVAQYRLAMMYYIGNVIPQDYVEATKWFQQSAEQGYPEAQFRYGCMLYYGRGVEKRDFVQAHMWFNLAAAADYKAADDYREMVAEKMTPQEITEAQKLAKDWKPKAK